MKGEYVGVQHSPVRLLVNHKAPVYLPLWHSSKPPLPVKVTIDTKFIKKSLQEQIINKSSIYGFIYYVFQLWGVDIVSGNAVNWLDCVAKGRQVTLKPISREKEELVSTVLLHLPQPKVLYKLGYIFIIFEKNIRKCVY